MTTKRLIFIALAIAITFVQEQLLLLIPNVSLTVLLIMLFSKHLKFGESLIYILIYVLLDSLYMGALNPMYMIPMFLSWSLIPLGQYILFNNKTTILKRAFFALGFGFVYGWVYIPFTMLMQNNTTLIAYIIADIPFELIMAGTGFITVLWLFEPLDKVLIRLFDNPKTISKSKY